MSRRTTITTLVLLTVLAAMSVALVLLTRDPFADFGIFAGGTDEDVYREGARRLMNRAPLYAGPVLYGLLYTYTPFSTIVFIPLGLFPVRDGTYWLSVNVVLLAACVWICLRMLGHRRSWFLVALSALAALACTFLEPIRTSLQFGQINIVLMLLVLWDVSRGERSRLRGVGIGIAAGIKLTPAFFILYYAAARRWRAAVAVVVTFLATVALGWAVLPSGSKTYWTDTFFNSQRISDDRNVANQSLRGMLARFVDGPAPTWLWLLLSVVVVVVAFAVSARLLRRGEKLPAVTLLGLTGTVVSPFSWSHHWVWFAPLLVFLLHKAVTARRVLPRWGCAIVAVGTLLLLGAWVRVWQPGGVVAVGLYLFARPFPDAEFYLLSNLYVWVYLVILAAAAVYAWWPRREANAVERAEGCAVSGTAL